MSLIDDAKSRSKRQLVHASKLFNIEKTSNIDNKSATEEEIMLDPLSNTQLKLYKVSPENIKKLNDVSWKPQLYLTSQEWEIVETSGTVLVLGQSGTGKTCVICNRMDYDQQRVEGQFGFSQLFVA
jgi:flagellar biosynthesis GTPase FlhF